MDLLSEKKIRAWVSAHHATKKQYKRAVVQQVSQQPACALKKKPSPRPEMVL
jgi:hypothetical protein